LERLLLDRADTAWEEDEERRGSGITTGSSCLWILVLPLGLGAERESRRLLVRRYPSESVRRKDGDEEGGMGR